MDAQEEMRQFVVRLVDLAFGVPYVNEMLVLVVVVMFISFAVSITRGQAE